MRPTSSVLCGSVLIAATMLATPVWAGDAASKQGGQRAGATVAYAGRVVRSTAAAVSHQRTIVPERYSTVILLWDETTGPSIEHYYALSLDAGRTFPLVLPTTYQVRLKYAEFDPFTGEPPVDEELRADESCRDYLVPFVIPPIDDFRRDLTGAGATVERFLTDNVHVVQMDPAAAARVAALPHVRWVGPY